MKLFKRLLKTLQIRSSRLKHRQNILWLVSQMSAGLFSVLCVRTRSDWFQRRKHAFHSKCVSMPDYFTFHFQIVDFDLILILQLDSAALMMVKLMIIVFTAFYGCVASVFYTPNGGLEISQEMKTSIKLCNASHTKFINSQYLKYYCILKSSYQIMLPN